MVVFAGDHGIADMHLSMYDQSQTKKVLSLLSKGCTPLNKIVDQFHIDLHCVDVGVNGYINEEGILDRKVNHGTKNIYFEDAMDDEDMKLAIEYGIEMATRCAAFGVDIAALGEVGISNTVSASVITAILCGLNSNDVTGRGTGITGEIFKKKKEIINEIIIRCSNCTNNPYMLLKKAGGYEICADVGFILGCAYFKIPVVLDGFITGAAALVANHIHDDATTYSFASHCSAEPGHAHILKNLKLTPILDLGMRYGLATGAAMALPLYVLAYKLTTGTQE